MRPLRSRVTRQRVYPGPLGGASILDNGRVDAILGGLSLLDAVDVGLDDPVSSELDVSARPSVPLRLRSLSSRRFLRSASFESVTEAPPPPSAGALVPILAGGDSRRGWKFSFPSSLAVPLECTRPELSRPPLSLLASSAGGSDGLLGTRLSVGPTSVSTWVSKLRLIIGARLYSPSRDGGKFEPSVVL